MTDTISDALRALADGGVRRHYARRTRFISEGDDGNAIYIILSGQVKVFTSDLDGKEFLFGSYGPGTILGEMALDGQPRSASVTALTAVQCAVVPVEVLRQRVTEDPAFALELIRTLIQRSRNTTTYTRRLALDSAYQRLVALLNELAVPHDGVRVIPEPLSQQAIGERIGTSRDMVSKLFKELVKGEYLRHENKQITLLRTLPAKW
ncbi:Crp/Fnr family transcriptional regulator [Duganella levis]|uniref:Cyclic nucleotide-binding domain-containing protein n=1 Tax=Duganella levis TaxID=2692169 RepID=A0ABW9VZ13_9BURK|nr:Crp/Fnr family transcriptional regulator [Duganella levis]MYN26934.1 cyclic nucleotide-binding domain-containing protein [Duganella levis]